MKHPALSVWQPWAWFLANGQKDYENRTWNLPEKFLNTKILIQASKKYDFKEINNGLDIFLKNKTYRQLKRLTKISRTSFYDVGGVIGYVVFDKVVTESESIWFAGPYGFHVKEFKELDFFPVRGHQKIFYVDLPKGIKL